MEVRFQESAGMKKRKLNAAQRQLQADWEKMMKQHTKPLEKGAKAKSQVSSAAPLSKKPIKLLESSRVNKQPSLDTGYTSTAPRAQMMYSGDKVLGVALMHKSSYAPVFDTESAQEIAKMRR